MTRRFRSFATQVIYTNQADEGALLARTSQFYKGVSFFGGVPKFRPMYGLRTPMTDDLCAALYAMHVRDKCGCRDDSLIVGDPR